MVTVNSLEHTFHSAVFDVFRGQPREQCSWGFKESLSFAFRFCRSCYVTNNTCKTLLSAEIKLRSDEKHRGECELVSGPFHEHYSRTYGINRCSALLDIPYYSMFDG